MSTDLPQSITTSRDANLKFILMLMDYYSLAYGVARGIFSSAVCVYFTKSKLFYQ